MFPFFVFCYLFAADRKAKEQSVKEVKARFNKIQEEKAKSKDDAKKARQKAFKDERTKVLLNFHFSLIFLLQSEKLNQEEKAHNISPVLVLVGRYCQWENESRENN